MTLVAVKRLSWSDHELGSIALPGGTLELRSGYGSGITRRKDDPPGHVWAIGDRGPNLKVKTAIELYGLHDLARLRDVEGAKLMPRPDLGPALAELRIEEDRVELVRELRISAPDGSPVSGLPLPGGGPVLAETAFDLEGNPLPPDPGGLDTEGIAALPDGGFWAGDEFGPSLVRLDAQARVRLRLIPEGVELDAPYVVEARLPALAARRQLNRGFEALAVSGDGRWLFLALQSPLAHPDEAAHEKARHVRLWRLEAESGAFSAQYLYPLDRPENFRRDQAKGDFGPGDIKVSEIAWAVEDTLIVLERGSETTKIYRVRLDESRRLGEEHMDVTIRPTVEELSGGDSDFALPVLEKSLLFSSDGHPDVGPDVEGIAILSPTELLLVSDNDFGVEGARTGFWRLHFDSPVLA